MKRYQTRRPRQCDEETSHDLSTVHHLEVFERGPVFTGLLDHRGDELWAMPNRMGFCRDDEE
jgi:hypothetical protein